MQAIQVKTAQFEKEQAAVNEHFQAIQDERKDPQRQSGGKPKSVLYLNKKIRNFEFKQNYHEMDVAFQMEREINRRKRQMQLSKSRM